MVEAPGKYLAAMYFTGFAFCDGSKGRVRKVGDFFSWRNWSRSVGNSIASVRGWCHSLAVTATRHPHPDRWSTQPVLKLNFTAKREVVKRSNTLDILTCTPLANMLLACRWTAPNSLMLSNSKVISSGSPSRVSLFHPTQRLPGKKRSYSYTNIGHLFSIMGRHRRGLNHLATILPEPSRSLCLYCNR